jgi:hypothetical protein
MQGNRHNWVSSEQLLRHKPSLKKADTQQNIGLLRIISRMKSAKQDFTKQTLIENNQKFKSDQDRFHKRISSIKSPQPSQANPFTSTVPSHKRCFSSSPTHAPENLLDAIRHNPPTPKNFTPSISTYLSLKNFRPKDPTTHPNHTNQAKYLRHQ